MIVIDYSNYIEYRLNYFVSYLIVIHKDTLYFIKLFFFFFKCHCGIWRAVMKNWKILECIDFIMYLMIGCANFSLIERLFSKFDITQNNLWNLVNIILQHLLLGIIFWVLNKIFKRFGNTFWLLWYIFFHFFKYKIRYVIKSLKIFQYLW